MAQGQIAKRDLNILPPAKPADFVTGLGTTQFC